MGGVNVLCCDFSRRLTADQGRIHWKTFAQTADQKLNVPLVKKCIVNY